MSTEQNEKKLFALWHEFTFKKWNKDNKQKKEVKYLQYGGKLSR